MILCSYEKRQQDIGQEPDIFTYPITSFSFFLSLNPEQARLDPGCRGCKKHGHCAYGGGGGVSPMMIKYWTIGEAPLLAPKRLLGLRRGPEDMERAATFLALQASMDDGDHLLSGDARTRL